jgi:hypothetical protein
VWQNLISFLFAAAAVTEKGRARRKLWEFIDFRLNRQTMSGKDSSAKSWSQGPACRSGNFFLIELNSLARRR